jgi:hypothetical protein
MQDNSSDLNTNNSPVFLQQYQTLSTPLGELIDFWSKQIPAGRSGLIPLTFTDSERPVTVFIAIGPESIQKITESLQP